MTLGHIGLGPLSLCCMLVIIAKGDKTRFDILRVESEYTSFYFDLIQIGSGAVVASFLRATLKALRGLR